MQKIQITSDVMTMKTPASWQGALWREGLPSGNGTIGANLFGGAKRTSVIVNHSALWSKTESKPLPDVHETLAQTRKALDEGRFQEASWTLTRALQAQGYDNELGHPLPLAQLDLVLEDLPGFSHYLRAVDMASGQVSVQFEEDGALVRQDLFVSRADRTVYFRIRAEKPLLNAALSLDAVPAGRPNPAADWVNAHKERSVSGQTLLYQSVDNDGLAYGAAAWVQSDASLEQDDLVLKTKGATWILVAVRVFVRGEGDLSALTQALRAQTGGYDAALAAHRALHEPLYRSAQLTLAEDCGHSNEELLLQAYDGETPLELVEKLWHFGRYLFVSGSTPSGMPFPLYGLWAGDYRLMWSHNMANENVQMIYWHTHVGNLEAFNRPLLRYYNEKLPVFRENAQKLYGMPGIWVPAGTTPNMALPCQVVPVIMNWSGAAGWIAQHYYRHFLYERDDAALLKEIVPFLEAAADFYEAFLVPDGEGRVKLYPSVSPENTPQNFMPPENVHMAHPMPTTVNATIDLAIVRELFTHLIALGEAYGLFGERIAGWRRILESLPPYRANADGAVREWQDDRFEDRYYHRHLSHLYPVFPGEEITTRDARIGMFERAVDLRQIGAQTGWSFAHMAALYARFGRGDDAIGCLDSLARTCLTANFFTLHNDWRQMDISVDMAKPPIQLDAAMGCVNAVQEMLLFAGEGLVKLLPALPGRMKRGSLANWRFPDGRVDLRWDVETGAFEASLTALRDTELTVALPPAFPDAACDRPCAREDGLLRASLRSGQTLRLWTPAARKI